MTTINPYLIFNGNCEEAFTFYKSIFGGEFTYLGYFDEMPSEYNVPESEKQKVMHVSLPIGETAVLMGSDSSDSFGKASIVGTNFSISINTNEVAEAERLFELLGTEGNITMPLNKTFWGSYFGSLIDKFGIQWMINCAES
ncbi:MAG: VOC family protein [Aureispira sp.]|nr:VOC family protein [Aureispira sp.]